MSIVKNIDRDKLVTRKPALGHIPICGQITYNTDKRINNNLPNLLVELWKNRGYGPEYLKYTQTDKTGHFDFGYIWMEEEEYSLKFFLRDPKSHITIVNDLKPGDYYLTHIINDPLEDQIIKIAEGNVELPPESCHIYKTLSMAVDFLLCPERTGNPPEKITSETIHFPSHHHTSHHHYLPDCRMCIEDKSGGNQGDGWDTDVILHEYGHHIMAQLYKGSGITFPGGVHWRKATPNTLSISDRRVLAWSEGFSNFFLHTVKLHYHYLRNKGSCSNCKLKCDKSFYPDLGNPEKYSDRLINGHLKWDVESENVKGAEAEGSVDGVLWDIIDPKSPIKGQKYQDVMDETFWDVYSLTKDNKPSNILEFGTKYREHLEKNAKEKVEQLDNIFGLHGFKYDETIKRYVCNCTECGVP